MTPPEWTAIGMFWATVGLVVISLVTAMITSLTLTAATAPHVIVYAKADQSRPSFIQIVIENVGQRNAKNVKFALSEPIPNKTAGCHGPDDPRAGPMTAGPLISGIPALGPKDSRPMIWGKYLILRELLGQRVITVTASFESDPLLGFGPMNDHSVVSLVDVFSFDETDAVDPDGGRQSARQLKRIADVVVKRL